MPETFIKPITRDVIIFATFFYKNSTSFGTAGKDTIVVLMLADHTDQFPNARCARQQINNKTLAPVVPKLTRYDYTGLCKLVLFMAFCHFSFENGTGLTDQRNETDQLSGTDQWNGKGIMIDMGIQVLADAHLHQYSAPIYHTLPVRMADRTPRNLVICISRLFAFEKWQLLFIAMETYKKLGVDLVVLHVISALSAVYELIKAYESEERLAVRNGLQLPFLEFMNFDPALQIEYSGQLAMAHECFYEFRESAKFIAMLDLDDLLISTKFPSLITALNAALVAYPMAPYFFINKRESGILLSRHNNKNNSFAQF
ncbi:hypothetical protein GPALN_014437 [Globodera pallida]|nr:hypothetical protein GPALN_014437 [Globodera pallida]